MAKAAKTLAQHIAIEQMVRNKTQETENELYKEIAKDQRFTGLIKTFTPKVDPSEGGETQPTQQQLVELKSKTVLSQLEKAVVRRIDVTATKDAANTVAKADIKIGSRIIAAGVPVTTLIYLEKETEKMTAFFQRMPVVDPGESWTYNPDVGYFASDPTETSSTKKEPVAFVKYEATKEHPAQVEVYPKDVRVGTWETIKFSGALKADQKDALLANVEQLRVAVKMAREEANTIPVSNVEIGQDLMKFVLEEVTSAL